MQSRFQTKVEQLKDSQIIDSIDFDADIIQKCQVANVYASAGQDKLAMEQYTKILNDLKTKAFTTFKSSYDEVLENPVKGLKIMETVGYYRNLHKYIDQYPEIVKQIKIYQHEFKMMGKREHHSIVTISNKIQECKKLLNQEIPLQRPQLVAKVATDERLQMKEFWLGGANLFSDLLQYDRKNTLYLDWLGYCNFKLASFSTKPIYYYKEGIKAYEQCVKINPDYFSAIFYKGRILMDWGLLQKDHSLIAQSHQLFNNLLDEKGLDYELEEKSYEYRQTSYQLLEKLAGSKEKANVLIKKARLKCDLVESIKQYDCPIINEMYFKPIAIANSTTKLIGQDKVEEFAADYHIPHN
jgi:hypothetical protein